MGSADSSADLLESGMIGVVLLIQNSSRRVRVLGGFVAQCRRLRRKARPRRVAASSLGAPRGCAGWRNVPFLKSLPLSSFRRIRFSWRRWLGVRNRSPDGLFPPITPDLKRTTAFTEEHASLRVASCVREGSRCVRNFTAGGIIAAVRIGFDDNRSLGSRETGGRLALPMFQELMLAVYHDKLLGPAPTFPAGMEKRVSASPSVPRSASARDVASDAVAHMFN